MELIFLGTGAAEGIPSAYCRCDYCSMARKNGGKDIRTRSSFRIDSRHQIDFNPDILCQMNNYGLDLFELEHLLITHSHEDHFDMAEIAARDCAVPDFTRPLNIYMNKIAADWTRKILLSHMSDDAKAVSRFLDTYRLFPVDYFETFRAGELEVISLKANHRANGPGELAQNYIISLKDNRKLLYAVDTGWYGEETWEFLKGKKVDLLIMECTYGGIKDRGVHPKDHQDIGSMLLMLEKMESIGFIDQNVKIYATHINHKHNLMHEDMQKVFDSSAFKVTVAYDGLKIE